MSVDCWPYVAVIVLVLLDILTGLVKAFTQGNVSSYIMREGLTNKLMYFLLLVTFTAVNFVQAMLNVWPDFPTVEAIAVYICVTEIVSILENIVAVNPEIGKWPIIKQLYESKVIDGAGEDAGDDHEPASNDPDAE